MCMLLCLMVSPSNDHGDTKGVLCHINRWGACVITIAEREGYVFISVGWSVCVSVSNITGKCRNGFSWNFRDMSSKIQGTIWKMFGVLCLTHSIQARSYIEVYSSMIQVFYIFFFSRKSVPVSNIKGKRMNGFSWNFQEILYMRQRTIWNVFVSWWLTP